LVWYGDHGSDAVPTRLPFLGVLLPHLNERQRRLAVAAEARLLGHGGVRAAARAAGMSETTVCRGVSELEPGLCPMGELAPRGEAAGQPKWSLRAWWRR
jgi:hypothetical protein